MMCLAGEVVYLGLRTRHLTLALFWAHALVSATLLAHPNGIFAFL